MTLENVESIVVLIQLKDGSAHQVLTTKTNKIIALQMIATADNGLKVDKELKPIVFETKE